jgi:hypothetical protein
MSANAAYTAVILGLLALVAIVIITVLILNARDKRRAEERRTEREQAQENWPVALHDLARRMLTLDTEDERTAGRVLLNHAHLLRPGVKHCGCPAPETTENKIIPKTVMS